jgi:hypothetical protein
VLVVPRHDPSRGVWLDPHGYVWLHALIHKAKKRGNGNDMTAVRVRARRSTRGRLDTHVQPCVPPCTVPVRTAISRSLTKLVLHQTAPPRPRGALRSSRLAAAAVPVRRARCGAAARRTGGAVLYCCHPTVWWRGEQLALGPLLRGIHSVARRAVPHSRCLAYHAHCLGRCAAAAAVLKPPQRLGVHPSALRCLKHPRLPHGAGS